MSKPNRWQIALERKSKHFWIRLNNIMIIVVSILSVVGYIVIILNP
jgi:hypothetical protein